MKFDQFKFKFMKSALSIAVLALVGAIDLGKKSMESQVKKSFIAWDDEEDLTAPYEQHRTHESGVMKGLSSIDGKALDPELLRSLTSTSN
jgi:hypothetical protein